MPLDNARHFNGGPAYPGKQIMLRDTGKDDRPLEPCEVEMNGMSVRDVATLQILGAMIQANRLCTPALIIEAFDMADVFIELRGQP